MDKAQKTNRCLSAHDQLNRHPQNAFSSVPNRELREHNTHCRRDSSSQASSVLAQLKRAVAYFGAINLMS